MERLETLTHNDIFKHFLKYTYKLRDINRFRLFYVNESKRQSQFFLNCSNQSLQENDFFQSLKKMQHLENIQTKRKVHPKDKANFL
jgi:hypothetical protein